VIYSQLLITRIALSHVLKRAALFKTRSVHEPHSRAKQGYDQNKQRGPDSEPIYAPLARFLAKERGTRRWSDLVQDQAACMQAVQQPPPSGTTDQQQYEACMNAHGWKLPQ
jgi:hypothetical protein